MADRDEERKSMHDKVSEALASGKPLNEIEWPEVSPLHILGLAYREAQESFEKAGFGSNQALYLVAAMFNGNPGIAPNGTTSSD